MRFSTAIAAFVPILAVSAAEITVLVGDGGVSISIFRSCQIDTHLYLPKLTFNPSSAQAQNGDTVNFELYVY